MQAVLGQEDNLPKTSLGIIYNSILTYSFPVYDCKGSFRRSVLPSLYSRIAGQLRHREVEGTCLSSPSKIMTQPK